MVAIHLAMQGGSASAVKIIINVLVSRMVYKHQEQTETNKEPRSWPNIKVFFHCWKFMAIVEIRWSYDHFIFTVEIPIMIKYLDRINL